MQEIQYRNIHSDVKRKIDLTKMLQKIDFVFCISAFSLWIKSLLFLFEVNRIDKINEIMSRVIESRKIMIVGVLSLLSMIAICVYLKRKNKTKELKYICLGVLLIVMSACMLSRKNYTVLYMPFGLFLLSIGLLFKGKNRLIAYTVIDALASLIIWMDAILLRAYGSFLSIEYIFHPSAFNSSNRNLLSYTKFQDILYFIDIVFLIYVCFKYREIYKERAKSRIRNIAFGLFMLFACSLWIKGIYYFYDVKDITNGKVTFFTPYSWDLQGVAQNTSSLGYHVYEIGKKLTISKEKKLTSAEEEEINKWFLSNDEKLPDNNYVGLLNGKNLIFLQVESMENFVVRETINDQEITPRLNKMLDNSYYFKNIYEQVYHNSADGDFLSNTGIYPLKVETSYRRYPFNTYNSLVNNFKKKNYTTISIHPEDCDGWNWKESHLGYGFEKIYDGRDFVVDEIVAGKKISDESLYKQTVEKLKNEEKPFLVHMATMTSHGPFYIIDEKKELNLNDELNKSMLGTYCQVMRYVDSSIGKFVDLLKENNLLDNTVLVIYGDHAGPHRYYQNEIDDMGEIDGIKKSWRNKDVRVPFIIYNPSIKGETIDTIGGQVDILPTTLSLFGIDKEEYINCMMGRNLLNTERNATVLANDTIIGTPNSEEEKQNLIQMTKISDKIIESNYFKGKY